MTLIKSLSGIRGVPNSDISMSEASRFAENFFRAGGSVQVLMGRDTRRTGLALAKAVESGLVSAGGEVLDYGVLTTPALFLESRLLERPAIMISASHNEPEYNGLKFMSSGTGIDEKTLGAVTDESQRRELPFGAGRCRRARRPVYSEKLANRFGDGSFEGLKVALDLGGGAAVEEIPLLFKRLGCEVLTINGIRGVFERTVDPISDELVALRKLVKSRGCDGGFAFDCDGDRLAIVDSEGKKHSGDFMLTLAIKELLSEAGRREVVVSVDTTQAIDDVVSSEGGTVYRSRVGEANVVHTMKAKGVKTGGEGSSGGLIDGEFNYCRDSMVAAALILRAIRKEGRKSYSSVPSYAQSRVAVRVSRKKAELGIARMAKEDGSADLTDGMKIFVDRRSWVLIRPSGTEDLVRVSAEAPSMKSARRLARSFARKLERSV